MSESFRRRFLRGKREENLRGNLSSMSHQNSDGSVVATVVVAVVV